MTIRDQQKAYLASIAQAFDVGDFDYHSPQELQQIDKLIAAGWQALKQDEEVEARINDIQQALDRKPIAE